MTHKYPGADWKPINKNFTPRKRKRTDLVVNHVAGGEARSLFAWFMNPLARASCHVYFPREGRPEQYVDLDMIAWGNGAANSRSIVIETQGGAAGKWNAHQVREMLKFWVYVHRHFGVPLRAVTTSKQVERGIAHHRLGVPATYAQKRRGVSQTGGELWSSAVGKVCPGPDRIKQIPGMIAQAQRLAAGNAPAPAPKPAPAKPASVSTRKFQQDANRYAKAGLIVDDVNGPVTRAWRDWTGKVQAALNEYKSDLPPLRIDDHYGWITARKVTEIQRRNGLVPDGMVGPIMIAWMRKQGSVIPDRPKNRP